MGDHLRLGGLFLQRNYHGQNEDPWHPGQRRGLFVAFSSDGIHFSPCSEPATYAIVDGLATWHYCNDR